MLMISIFWEAMKKNSDNSPKDWRIQAQSSSTASIQLPNTNILINGKVLEVDHFKYFESPQTKDGRNIIEGSKDQMAQLDSVMTRPAILWKNLATIFL